MSTHLLRPCLRIGHHWPHHSTSLSRYLSSAQSAAHVAFIGLGNMGMQMAIHLAKGTNLIVYDLHSENVSRFMKLTRDRGMLAVTEARNLSTVAHSKPDFIVTSLPTCEASESVVGTILEHYVHNRGTTFIDTSTVSVSTSRKLYEMTTSLSHNYVDAPVSGGVKGATDATLTFMVGCSHETLTSIEPLLSKMGKSIIPCGGPGSGSAAKLCNNLALAAQMVGICEAMNLGEELGVDPKVLAGVMNVSTAKCWSSQVNNPHPMAAMHMGSGASAKGYEGGFGSALMLKDLNLAMKEAAGKGLVMPVSGLTRDLYKSVDADGNGNKDFGFMLQFLKQMKLRT